MAAVLGVDGCRGGWLGARLDGPAVQWVLLPDAVAVLNVDAAVIAIDIPIGLPEASRRDCDGLARRLPGMNPSSVFPVPPRPVFTETTYPAANACSRAVLGKGLSKQTWAIMDKIRDVDEALGDPPDARVIEVHPEVSFRHLAPGPYLSKHTVAGIEQRRRVLGTVLDVDRALDAVPGRVAPDDALDALAAAWTARRWLAGTAVVLPPDPPADERGRPMRIVA